MTINQKTQTDPDARARVVKLGLDIHSSLIVVVRQVDERASQPPQRFSEEGFIGFVHRQLAQAECVPSCYEAGPFGYVLHRRLVALGVQNLIVRPRDWSTYGERVKTDSRDAGALGALPPSACADIRLRPGLPDRRRSRRSRFHQNPMYFPIFKPP
jgi:hypothetical protein